MLSLAASAVYLAIMKSQVTNVLGDVLTFYLVITAWLTASRRAGETGVSDWGLLLFGAWRCFWHTTFGASSLAHVLCTIFRHRIFLPGTSTSVPRLPAPTRTLFLFRLSCHWYW
jgi:hypothetical protein